MIRWIFKLIQPHELSQKSGTGLKSPHVASRHKNNKNSKKSPHPASISLAILAALAAESRWCAGTCDSRREQFMVKWWLLDTIGKTQVWMLIQYGWWFNMDGDSIGKTFFNWKMMAISKKGFFACQQKNRNRVRGQSFEETGTTKTLGVGARCATSNKHEANWWDNRRKNEPYIWWSPKKSIISLKWKQPWGIQPVNMGVQVFHTIFCMLVSKRFCRIPTHQFHW